MVHLATPSGCDRPNTHRVVEVLCGGRSVYFKFWRLSFWARPAGLRGGLAGNRPIWLPGCISRQRIFPFLLVPKSRGPQMPRRGLCFRQRRRITRPHQDYPRPIQGRFRLNKQLFLGRRLFCRPFQQASRRRRTHRLRRNRHPRLRSRRLCLELWRRSWRHRFFWRVEEFRRAQLTGRWVVRRAVHCGHFRNRQD